MIEIKERCGVIALSAPHKSIQVSRYAFDGLMALQHRGQESAGIYVFNGKSIEGYKGLGLVSEVFSTNILSGLIGNVAIGHVRYSTTAKSDIENAQPYHFSSTYANFALAFNGTISNFLSLRKELEEKGHVFTSNSDTEVIAHLIASNLLEVEDYMEALSLAMTQLKGAYSMVLLTETGEIYAVRDPLGFKPLCLGVIPKNEIYVVASETAAIDTLSGEFLNDVAPGEIVRICEGEVTTKKAVSLNRHARCMFEFVYFSRPDSVFDGISIYKAREKLGRILYRLHPAEADLVVPVPDSGRCAATGYSEESGIPIAEGLMKNRYVWRTFIMPTQSYRENQVRLKFNPVKSVVEGRDIVLVDDSIVRATTIKRIVHMLKKAGAKKVHVRISCPPIIAACYMGIDFPTRRELIAANCTVKEICNFIEADSLGYMTIDGLLEGIGLPENELCLACLNCKYPIEEIDFELLEKTLGGERR
ncbi:MAG: amidophosphoribosyltransferase [Candidatus Jordarchaeales archaeon]